MQFLINSLVRAIQKILEFDPYVLAALRISLECSAVATVLGAMVGIPIGTIFVLKSFPGRNLAIIGTNALMSMPTVVIALLLYGFFCHQGPFGFLNLLYTPAAIIVGESFLIIPIVASLTQSSLAQLHPSAHKTLATLGIHGIRKGFMLLCEARTGIVAAIVTAGSRAIGEVGIAMILGGNILGFTRTMTTAIALETSKGSFENALAIGFILGFISIVINLIIHYIQLAIKNNGPVI